MDGRTDEWMGGTKRRIGREEGGSDGERMDGWMDG